MHIEELASMQTSCIAMIGGLRESLSSVVVPSKTYYVRITVKKSNYSWGCKGCHIWYHKQKADANSFYKIDMFNSHIYINPATKKQAWTFLQFIRFQWTCMACN